MEIEAIMLLFGLAMVLIFVIILIQFMGAIVPL